jgi:hypothetical protein
MRPILQLALLFVAASSLADSQSAPSATSGAADLKYAIRFSETANFGGTLDNWNVINPSGSVNYTNGHKTHPFALDYAGGYTATLSGPSYSTGIFQRLLVSQAFDWRKWNASFADDVSYQPQAPTTGFSGIPGTGEPIGPGSNPSSTQYILTVNTHTVNNNAKSSVEHILNYASSFTMDADYGLLRFPDGNGIDTDSLMANGGFDFRLNARNTVTSQYLFSRFSYTGYSVNFVTNTVLFGFQRQWNRPIHTEISVGPQWMLDSSTTGIPSSVGVAARASMDYQARFFSAALTYSRGTSGGSGYFLGAQTNTVSGGLARELGRKSSVELTTSFLNNMDLSTKETIRSVFGGLQATTQIGRYLSFFANYTASSQLSDGQVPSNVLSQLLQVVSCGINYNREVRTAH